MEVLQAIDAADTCKGIVDETRDTCRYNEARRKGGGVARSHPFHLVDKPDPALEFSITGTTNCICGKVYDRRTKDDGTFVCPVCQELQKYKHKKLMLKCHWYWIIRCGGEDMGEYVKCANCDNHFDTSVVGGQSQLLYRSMLQKSGLEKALLAALILVSEASRGQTYPFPAAQGALAMRELYDAATGKTITEEDIADQVARNRAYKDLDSKIKSLCERLALDQNEKVLKATLALALVLHDGKEIPEVTAAVRRTVRAVGISNERHHNRIKGEVLEYFAKRNLCFGDGRAYNKMLAEILMAQKHSNSVSAA